MLFFRSEADLDTWLQSNDYTRGATLTVPQLWGLSQRWYHNRLDVEYHGRTLEQVQAIFKEAGLVSEFWLGTTHHSKWISQQESQLISAGKN